MDFPGSQVSEDWVVEEGRNQGIAPSSTEPMCIYPAWQALRLSHQGGTGAFCCG